LRPLGKYDEKDGAAVGDEFMIKTKEESMRKKGVSQYQIRVALVVNKHLALKEFVGGNPWFPSLVQGMLNNRLRDPTHIKAKLENLSNREALTIGRSFSLALFDRLVADAAADMFINEYGSLVELNERERFFFPMVVKIGQRKLDKDSKKY
jgi:hypothetical protein